jgi:hypothetical protein
MFNEEELDSYQAIVVEAGLPVGRIIYPLTVNVTPNVILATGEDGPFWYGDIDAIHDADVLKSIEEKIGKPLITLM